MRAVRDTLLRSFCALSLVALAVPFCILTRYIFAPARAALHDLAMARDLFESVLERTWAVGLGAAFAVAAGLLIGMHLARMPSRKPAERWLRIVVAFSVGAPAVIFWTNPPTILGNSIALRAFVRLFPMVAVLTEIAVRRVPSAVNDAAVALGIPFWRASLSVVLRYAWPQIAVGVSIVFAIVAFQSMGFVSEYGQGRALEMLVWVLSAVATYALLRSVLASLRLFR